MTTYIELCNYFAALSTPIPAIKTITIGADEDLIDSQSARVMYPHMRVATPTIAYIDSDEGDQITQYKFQIFILKSEPQLDYKAQNARLSECETIMRAVYNKLWQDADSGLFDLVLGSVASGDAIRKYSADNLFGWYMNVTINLYTATCE